MATSKKPATTSTPAKVTLVPTGTAFIPGVPAREQTVSAARARELLRWQPPAFTVKESSKAKAKAAAAPVNEAPAAPATGGEN